MGREKNLTVLIPYIISALDINAVDNYWMIDMTRNLSDHLFVREQHRQLSSRFPGRVHLHNSEDRSKIITNPDRLDITTGSWGVFYNFLRRFNNNDVIAKCDDDICYIDVCSLYAAFELRWLNKQPFIMHANCINNGVCAYHQTRHGIWSDERLQMYPTGGLTGPLFSEPTIARDIHNKFISELTNNQQNLTKFKLYKNIHFCNRVSINFIFMLGQDINLISKIDKQDEYQISCKLPQSQDRTNLLIGDFLVSHYAYGCQQQLLDETDIMCKYQKLSNIINSDTIRTHDSITQLVNKVTTLRSGGKYYMRTWIKNNTTIIQDPTTNEYICIRNKILVDEGEQIIRSYLSTTRQIKHACMFNLSTDQIEPVYLNNSASVLNTPLKSTQRGFTSCYPVSRFFQKNKNSNHIRFEKCGDDIYVIRPDNDPGLCLSRTANKLQYSTRTTQWRLIRVSECMNDVILGDVIRYIDDKFSNDATYITCDSHHIPDENILREWKWMIRGHIWEKIRLDNHKYNLRLVADDNMDAFLNFCNTRKRLYVDKKASEWTLESLSELTK